MRSGAQAEGAAGGRAVVTFSTVRLCARFQTVTGLTCPKCQGQMRSYERSGVTVDQCSECRGIFLDRGELEKLIDAEDTHYSAPPPQQPQQQQRQEPPR